MPKVAKQNTNKVPVPKATHDKIQSIDEALGEGLKVNVYGPSGSGKTTFWATFPKPILALICSGGSQPGELRSINTPEYRKTIKQWRLESAVEIFEATEFIKTSNFKTVVLDHATGLQDLVLKELLGLDQAPVQLSWGLATQQQWGQVGVQMKELLRSLLNLQQHVVIVAQERSFNDDSGGSDLLMPYVASALSPSITGWLNPACDYILQTFKRQRYVTEEIKVGDKTTKMRKPGTGVDYCLRTAPHEVYTTKFRVPKGVVLPDDIIDPTFDKVMKLINGG